MKNKEIKISYSEYATLGELDSSDQKLIALAIESLDSAYAPYSLFRVGAALLLEGGITVKGSNQENAAFPSGICAERAAFFAAGSQYPGLQIRTVAIIASPSTFTLNDPVSPCGACRQVISEYEHKQASPIRILLHHPDGRTWVFSGIDQLLPLGFQESSLKK